GVRRADHDPGVPAPGPAGRGDGGSSMRQDLSDAWYRLPVAVRRGVVPIAVLALFIFYPEYVDQLSAQWFPQMGVMVQMCVFAMMALGLNVVVGYAGLLDLGYVAFYAAGAYIAGLFATQQF